MDQRDHPRIVVKFAATAAERRSLRRRAADDDTTVSAIVRAALGFDANPMPADGRASAGPLMHAHGRTSDRDSARSPRRKAPRALNEH
jgi:hypothetical protein